MKKKKDKKSNSAVDKVKELLDQNPPRIREKKLLADIVKCQQM